MIDEEGIKRHIDEKMGDLKKTIERESGEDDRLQDVVDLLTVLVGEIRGMREDMKQDNLNNVLAPSHIGTAAQPVYPTVQPGSWSGTSAQLGSAIGSVASLEPNG